MEFIAQPDGTIRIGEFLIQELNSAQWTEFRAAVAFVKRSGTKHIREALRAFSERGATVEISVGVDARGTSLEGLSDLLEAVEDRGTVYVYHNASASTFHPKVYLFKNDEEAEVIVGSGNLTEGGLFTNYEASVRMHLDLGNEADAVLFREILAALRVWSTPTDGECYVLNPELLQRLVADRLVPDERSARSEGGGSGTGRTGTKSDLFSARGVKAAPKAAPVRSPLAASIVVPELVTRAAELEQEPVGTEGSEQPYRVFVMTLQQTDMGVGQTTAGTSRRSPEIFLPLVARDFDPSFWGWPDLFVPDAKWSGPVDRDGRGKMDRSDVMVQLGGATLAIQVWYNPDKKDVRLRSADLRSAGSVGDILYVERTDGSAGYDYYVDVVPQGSQRHALLLARCTHPVKNSKKLFGYY